MAADIERFTIREDTARLDVVLAARRRLGSRSKAKEALKRGKVDVDGVTVGPDRAGQPVFAGAEVEIHWSRQGTSARAGKAAETLARAGVRILAQRAPLIVVDKPPGLLTDAATFKQARARNHVRVLLDDWLMHKGLTAHVCHRIDRDTSGCIVFATDEKSCAWVRDRFAAREPERVYLALVQGQPRTDAGTWEHWMAWDRDDNRQLVVAPDTPEAVLTRAHYTVVQRLRGAALLEVRLESGRRNQIRVHLQAEGIPLLGERQYLPDDHRPSKVRMPRQALHAHRIAVPHPKGGVLTVTSPLPDDMARAIASLSGRRR